MDALGDDLEACHAAAERVSPHGGTALVEIGAEVIEQMDIVPQQVRVIQHQRVSCACRYCD